MNETGAPIQTTSAAGVETPIVIDLGKAKRKRVKDLKRGQGPLMVDVQAALQQVRATMGASGQDKQLVPVVVLYKVKKRRSGKNKGLGMWGL